MNIHDDVYKFQGFVFSFGVLVRHDDTLSIWSRFCVQFRCTSSPWWYIEYLIQVLCSVSMY